MAVAAAAQQWRYDVFLSFRGEDTRNNFTSHLYKELCQKGIITFKDDRELLKGEPVPQQLPKAIQDSRILVVVFSKNYATSRWCLNELAKIYECQKGGRQTALPIFYDVTPSQVRKQSGEYGEPFAEYKKLYKDKVQQWRDASTEVANLSGWDLKDRDESEFIQDIVKEILRQLRRSSQSIAKDFVGMDLRLEKMNLYLDIEQLSEVRVIGICGMGGIGKTAIASVVYKEMYCQFGGSSFLADVRENSKKYGLLSLQKQLLSATLMEGDIEVYDVYRGAEEIRNRLGRKMVMVILDDVDQLEQLELLIGKRDEYWFGIGTRIIITTRDEHLLHQHGVDEIYKVEELNHDEALQLFCSKAFRNNFRSQDYVELSNKVVEYAGGLPLAVDVLGSFLYGKSVREWKSTLDRLKEIPNEKILSKLRISYDGLDGVSQKIFLDIACFFKGMEKDYVIKVLESCGLFPESGIGELIDKSLITILYLYVRMHDLIQEMGRELVREESHGEPGQCSRIWQYKDLYHIQMKDTEATKVKAIVLNSCEQKEDQVSAKVFSKVKELRLLILRNLPLCDDIEHLSNELRYMEWYEYPFKSLPANFEPSKLVELHMQCSRIEQLWKRSIKPIKLLKIIDLSNSKNLIRTPDFTEVPNLEELILEGCIKLHEVHQSIGVLKRLFSLNLKNCKSLMTLPSSMCNLKALKILILRGCSKFVNLPERLENMTCLEKFDAAGIGMKKLSLAKQWDFNLPSWLRPRKNPHSMATVLPSLSALPFLKELDLSYCNLPQGAIPNDLSCFPSLTILNLSGNDFVTLPSSINQLSQITCLSISDCKRLQSLPDLPSNIKRLVVDDCTSLESLPNIFEKHNAAKSFEIQFSNCFKLNDCHGNFSNAFTWLKSFLLSYLEIQKLLKIRQGCQSQDESNTTCIQLGTDLSVPITFPDFRMHIPGSDIPDWFTYQSVKSPLRVELPPNVKLWDIVGFVICAATSGGRPGCEFTINSETKQVWNRCFGLTIARDFRPMSHPLHHLCLFFVPNATCDECSPTEVLLAFWGIHKCGMRILHDQDIEKLIEFDKPLENLDENMPRNEEKGEEEEDDFLSAFDSDTDLSSSTLLVL